MSGLTLIHVETDVEPECRVTFGGGRLDPQSGQVDRRRIELTFTGAYHVRAGPKPDGGGIESVGYTVESGYVGDAEAYLDSLSREWAKSGICPHPGFYVAVESDWANQILPPAKGGWLHYVIVGRDGFVEVLADRYAWREWMWSLTEKRDDNSDDCQVVAGGEGNA